MISKLIEEMERYLGANAGFVVRDTIERLRLETPIEDPKKRKLLVDVLCDEMLNLSVAKTQVLKSRLYGLFNVKSYSNDLQYWR